MEVSGANQRIFRVFWGFFLFGGGFEEKVGISWENLNFCDGF